MSTTNPAVEKWLMSFCASGSHCKPRPPGVVIHISPVGENPGNAMNIMVPGVHSDAK